MARELGIGKFDKEVFQQTTTKEEKNLKQETCNVQNRAVHRTAEGSGMIATLTEYDAARHALALARTVDDVKRVRDKAEALCVYAKRAKDVDMQNWAAEIRARAERRAGQLLIEMRSTGQRQKQGDSGGKGHRKSSATTINHLGITKDQSSKWQRLAEASETAFEHALRIIAGNGKELTTACLLRELAPTTNKKERPVLVEIQKRLSPLLPDGADGDLLLATLLEEASVLERTSENERDFDNIVAMLDTISTHFASCAVKLRRSTQVARVA